MQSVVYLVKMQEKDLEQVLRWRNSSRVRYSMFTTQVITLKNHIEWFNNCKERNDIQNFVCYLADKAIGVVNITNINFENMTCSWSIYRGEENSQHGIGFEMGKCALEYIFNELKIKKVYVDVLSSNIISKKFHEKLGFKIEKIIKDQITCDGSKLDILRMEISNKG